MSADSAGQRVAARVSDDDLLDALDDAAEDHGSKSEAIRAALREVYGDRDGVGDDVIDAVLPDDPMVKRGYRILVEEAAPFTSRIDVEAAESRIADRTNLPSNVVRRRVINPLARHRVGDDPIVKPVWGVLVVRPPEDLAEFVPTGDAPSDSPSDELEELAAAGEAVVARRGDCDA